MRGSRQATWQQPGPSHAPVLENWLSWLAGDLAMPGCGLEEAVRRLAGGSHG